MTQLENEIYNVLKYFGPMILRDIQAKLDTRGIVKSQVEIEKVCQEMVNKKLIKEATGFNDIAFKI